MRNHSCTFVKYCDRYNDNRCQGCGRAYESISIERERKILENWLLSYENDSMRVRYSYDNKTTKKGTNMAIKNVIFNDPATIVYWEDGTKTVVKCQGDDTYSKETGLAVAIAKKALGNKGNFNEVFKKWIPEYGKDEKK